METTCISGKIILVVEDDHAIRTDLMKLLESEGYIVKSAGNGKEALTFLNTALTPPALILLDIMMPIMDGWQFRASQLQEPKFAVIPLVVMTADGHAPQKAQKMNAQGFVTKPINIDHFLDAVAQYAI